MFLHLGGDFSVRANRVISVQDYSCLTETKKGREFLKRVGNHVEDLSEGKPKSVVVTDHQIYLSKLSPRTLKKRVEDLWIFPLENNE